MGPTLFASNVSSFIGVPCCFRTYFAACFCGPAVNFLSRCSSHSICNVCVDIQCCVSGGVAQNRGRCIHIYSMGQCVCSKAVSQIVEADLRQSHLLQDPVEPVQRTVRADGPAGSRHWSIAKFLAEKMIWRVFFCLRMLPSPLALRLAICVAPFTFGSHNTYQKAASRALCRDLRETPGAFLPNM